MKTKSDWEKKLARHIFCCDGDWCDGSHVNHNKEDREFVKGLVQQARQEGIEEAIKFMKGKIIDMPVGSGMPLVVKEAQVRKWLNNKSELKKKGIK